MALIANILEIRTDAYKIVRFFRRPNPKRRKDVGIWFDIVKTLTYMSIVINAAILCFTSNYVTHLVHKISAGKYNEEGFLDYELSYFNVSDLEVKPEHSKYKGVTICRYADFRQPPTKQWKYYRNHKFWQIHVVKLLFLFIYQNIALLFIAFIRWCIPEIPKQVKYMVKKERDDIRNYLIKKT